MLPVSFIRPKGSLVSLLILCCKVPDGLTVFICYVLNKINRVSIVNIHFLLPLLPLLLLILLLHVLIFLGIKSIICTTLLYVVLAFTMSGNGKRASLLVWPLVLHQVEVPNYFISLILPTAEGACLWVGSLTGLSHCVQQQLDLRASGPGCGGGDGWGDSPSQMFRSYRAHQVKCASQNTSWCMAVDPIYFGYAEHMHYKDYFTAILPSCRKVSPGWWQYCHDQIFSCRSCLVYSFFFKCATKLGLDRVGIPTRIYQGNGPVTWLHMGKGPSLSLFIRFWF